MIIMIIYDIIFFMCCFCFVYYICIMVLKLENLFKVFNIYVCEICWGKIENK